MKNALSEWLSSFRDKGSFLHNPTVANQGQVSGNYILRSDLQNLSGYTGEWWRQNSTEGPMKSKSDLSQSESHGATPVERNNISSLPQPSSTRAS